MVVEISTSFAPLRLSLRRQEPVQIKVILRNLAEQPKRLTMQLTVSNELSFSKGGYKNKEFMRIDDMPAYKSRAFYFDIFPKPNTREGSHPIEIKVQEHSHNYDITKDTYIHRTELVVA